MLDEAFGLYRNGFFGEAISLLLPLAEHDEKAARLMAECCLAMGLEGKARDYLRLSDIAEMRFEEFKARTDIPQSVSSRSGFSALDDSFGRHGDIWRSLAVR
ncbi:MAG: hypothetical protein K6F46_03755 [Desulfovibrio sp.]|nr:hypothetical protein [Desulfovibrio sp.]